MDLVVGGVDSRSGYVLKILYVKTKELGPLGGCVLGAPPRSANVMRLCDSQMFGFPCRKAHLPAPMCNSHELWSPDQHSISPPTVNIGADSSGSRGVLLTPYFCGPRLYFEAQITPFYTQITQILKKFTLLHLAYYLHSQSVADLH